MIKRQRWLVAAAILGVFLPLFAIWYPELRHYYVAVPSIAQRTTEAALSDLDARACKRFASHDVSALAGASPAQIAAAIEGLRQSMLVVPGAQPIPFHPDFAPDDLVRGGGAEQLNSASLIAVDVMLAAWRHTGDSSYLPRARAYIDGWWQFEKSAWLPRGLQWNDHAVAARTFVLTHYLCAVRALSDFGDDDAADVLRMIVATGERLMKPGYFTIRTNHGVMQNLALLHIAASLPALPQSPRFRDAGASRFSEQLDVYVSPEGSINEHSAGYQAFGVALLEMAIEYFDALGIPAPAALQSRYSNAVALYRTLLRPDGTLPSWGDTRQAVSSYDATANRDVSVKKDSDWWGPFPVSPFGGRAIRHMEVRLHRRLSRGQILRQAHTSMRTRWRCSSGQARPMS